MEGKKLYSVDTLLTVQVPIFVEATDEAEAKRMVESMKLPAETYYQDIYEQGLSCITQAEVLEVEEEE